jgi:hypothetical protein
MLNSIIWFLTDTDFSREWSKSSFFGKLELLYTVSGFLLCELLNGLFLIDIIF